MRKNAFKNFYTIDTFMERDDLKIILNILYEMEGLVDMAIRREDETPAGVMCLIKEKSEMLHKYTSAWNIENDIEIKINEDYSIDEESELDVNDEDIEVEFVYDESEDESVDDSEDNSEDETEVDEEPQAEQESTIFEKEVVESSLFDASAFSDEDSTEDELNNDVDYDNEQQEETDYESEELDEDEAVEEEESFIEAKVVNANRQDIRKMFTINDRYRFRRELFCNNEVDFVDNLNLVQAMSCYEDAEDYFYNDLQWDSENEDVVEFMSIIFKYFNS